MMSLISYGAQDVYLTSNLSNFDIFGEQREAENLEKWKNNILSLSHDIVIRHQERQTRKNMIEQINKGIRLRPGGADYLNLIKKYQHNSHFFK